MTTTINLNDLRDLPEELLQQLKGDNKKKRTNSSLVLEAAEALQFNFSLNQLLIAIYQKHKIIIKRATVSAEISALKKDGKIERISEGRWSLKFICEGNKKIKELS